MEWRAVPGFEGSYEASAGGDIRRIGSGRGVVSGRILKAQSLPAGYLIYALWKKNRQHMRLAHVLIALTFLGPRPPGHEVNHKNFNKRDNRAANLEYVTRSANLLHRSAVGIGRGVNNASARLNEASVIAIRRRHANGEGYKNLGKAYGVTWETIRQIVKRRSWAWLEE